MRLTESVLMQMCRSSSTLKVKLLTNDLEHVDRLLDLIDFNWLDLEHDETHSFQQTKFILVCRRWLVNLGPFRFIWSSRTRASGASRDLGSSPGNERHTLDASARMGVCSAVWRQNNQKKGFFFYESFSACGRFCCYKMFPFQRKMCFMFSLKQFNFVIFFRSGCRFFKWLQAYF